MARVCWQIKLYNSLQNACQISLLVDASVMRSYSPVFIVHFNIITALAETTDMSYFLLNILEFDWDSMNLGLLAAPMNCASVDSISSKAKSG